MMSRMKPNRLAHVATCSCTGASVLSSAGVLRRRVPPVRAGADGGGWLMITYVVLWRSAVVGVYDDLRAATAVARALHGSTMISAVLGCETPTGSRLLQSPA